MYQPEKLKRRRTEIGLRQIDVAEAIGISKQSYFAWEKGITQPNQKNLLKLEKVLEVEPGYFTTDDISVLYQKLTHPNQSKAKTFMEKLLEQQEKVISIAEPRFEYHVYEKMSAGRGATIYGDRDYDTVYFDKEISHDFASWVFGDSMEPTYLNGEVVLIKQTGFDYDGDVYAVDWDGQTYIKKVYREEDGLRLVSLNTKYSDLIAPYDEEPRIVGKIVGHFLPIEY